LEPGGILRIVVPDLQVSILEYVEKQPLDNPENRESMWKTSADRFNHRLSLRKPSPLTGNYLYKLYITKNDFNSHKWMYDTESLSYYFRWSGFTDVQKMTLHQSRIMDINKIEIPERVLNAVCIEGIRPK
jgi:predicted SAM-dependent methyltransferase